MGLRPADPIRTATQFIELVWGTLTRRLVIGTVALPDAAECEGIVEAAVALFLHGLLTPEEIPRKDHGRAGDEEYSAPAPSTP